MGRKKLRCPNCGTLIKDDEKSCSVCHQLIQREEKEDDDFELTEQFPIAKVVFLVLIFIGIVLTVKGFVEFQNVEYCTADDCGLRSLFMAGVGLILIIAASISLAREGTKYKVKA